jgi:hypothetical protein
MKNTWKPIVAGLVIIAAAFLIVTGLSNNQAAPPSTGGDDGSSNAIIDKAFENGKPTLLLLRTET